jgi:cytochrome c peroxidase
VSASGGGTNAPSAGDTPVGPEATTDTTDAKAIARTLAPDTLPGPVVDASNAYADNVAAAALGKKLFFDAEFAGALLDLDDDGGPNALGVRGNTGKVSCAGCHESERGYLDTRSAFKEISLGAGWTGRRTPSLLDVGQARIVMWGGRHSTLYAQVFGPLENPLEMNSSRLFAATRIADRYASDYEAVFGAGTLSALGDTTRFPRLTPATTGCRLLMDVDHPRASSPDPMYECHGMPGDQAEYDLMAEGDHDLVTRIVVNMGKAVAAYERQLTCGAGRFDAWVHGDAHALDASEQRGYALFVGKAGCVTCHSGPYFSDQKFHNLGLAEAKTRAGVFNGNDHGAARDLATAAQDPLGVSGRYSDGNDGRLPSAIGPEMEGAFRTPALRCVGQRPSFMHSGLIHTLADVVAFFNRGGDASGSYHGTGVLRPLGLSADEQTDLVAFLQSLDGPGPRPELTACEGSSCAK